MDNLSTIKKTKAKDYGQKINPRIPQTYTVRDTEDTIYSKYRNSPLMRTQNTLLSRNHVELSHKSWNSGTCVRMANPMTKSLRIRALESAYELESDRVSDISHNSYNLL